MAEPSQEKTEAPTPHKLREARKRGEVALSRDLTSSLILAVATAVVAYQAESIGAEFRALAEVAFGKASAPNLTSDLLLTTFSTSCYRAALVLAPVLVLACGIAALVLLVQIGPLVTFEPLKPKMEKLNPIAGIKRMFFSLPPYVELMKGVFKVTIVGLLCWQVMHSEFREIALVGMQPPMAVLMLMGRVLTRCVIRVVVFFLALSVLDLIYQRWQFMRNQRMTKEEIKREYKEQEGDPSHKAARQRTHEEIATSSMLQDVRQADVVVTNPTHIACALRYDPGDEDVPRLLGKGRGFLAQKIKEIANEAGIPVIRNVPLAHALHELEVNDLIPEDLFEAVAEVLRWVEAVLRERGELPSWLREESEPSE
ncbi:MAG: flagellar biosynthesis protein FlhB [Phycisphaerae bacterium]